MYDYSPGADQRDCCFAKKKKAPQNPGREQGENNHQCTLTQVMPGGL